MSAPITPSDARLQRLRATLSLVAQLARDPDIADCDATRPALMPDGSVARRRYTALLDEVSLWAATGLATLMRQRDHGNVQDAAGLLADEIRAAVARLERLGAL